MAPQQGTLWLGTQGFAFDDWVGPFYPPGPPKAAYLETYARAFSTVEIDSTFYATPRASVVEGWARRTPDVVADIAKRRGARSNRQVRQLQPLLRREFRHRALPVRPCRQLARRT